MVVVVIVVVVVVVGSSGSGSSNRIYNAKKNSIIKKIKIRTTAATGLSWNIIQFKRVIAE